MYERNAIVLERYFYGIFDFKAKSNLKENYNNYRKLYECYGTLCDAKEKEKKCQLEFDESSKEISNLQKTQEKLYNKSAKYEYSRYIIFTNIEEAPEKIEKHLNKVNDDVEKNNNDLIALGENFTKAVADYDEKKKNLDEAKKELEKAQEEYDNSYKISKDCFEGITDDMIQTTRKFISSDNKENKKELQEIFEENGKNEKNQFDQDVISNTINKSIEIYKLEMDIYLAGFDRISKLFEEIETDSVKTDKHSKYYRDSKAKIEFLNSEKDYIVQFLDNERIGAIYDKKSHRKLMLEACKKFVLDFAQIEKLYDIVLKEAAGRATKKIYKENYNKDYIVKLENASTEPDLDTGKMRQNAIALVNLNYWRVEGMTSVYNAFEDIVTNIYERDLSEFIPEELKEAEELEVETQEENQKEEINNEPEISSETLEEEKVESEEAIPEEPEEKDEVIAKEKIRPRFVYYSSKKDLANAIYYSLQTQEFAESNEKEEAQYEEQKEYTIPKEAEEIIENFETEEKKDVPEKTIASFETEEPKEEKILEEPKEENIEKIDEPKLEPENSNNYELEEKISKELDELPEEEKPESNDTFDLSKLDEIEDDDSFDDDESDEDEESILDIYFNDDSSNNNSNEPKEENIIADKVEKAKKKVGFFQKLVGFNSKEKKKANT